MVLTMDMGTGSMLPKRERGRRHRQWLMLGASALLHLAVLGPMIHLAHGEDLLAKLAKELPIIQVQLEPPFQPERPRPLPVPVPLPQKNRPLDQAESQPTVTPQVTEEAQPSESLDSPRPTPEVWPVARNLPAVAPTPELPKAEAMEDRASAPSLNPLNQSLPSLAPVSPQAVESLEAPGSVSTPAPITSAPPSMATAPAAANAASQANANDLPLRRRDEEAERAAAAAAAAAASGPPSPPVPRLANPAPGSMAPSGGAASGSAVPGISDGWRVAPSTQGDRNSRALRTSPTGCRFPERLSEGEREICRERFNADAAQGAERPITGSGNAARDARFRAEGAREMYRYEEQRRPLSGGTGNVGPADCPGSNMGTGCAGSLLDPSLQMDSSSNIQTKRDGPKPRGVQVPGSSGATGRPGNGQD